MKNKTTFVLGSISTRLIIGFLIIALGACQQKGSSSDLYYPIDSLLHAQIFILCQEKGRIEKTAVLKGNESKVGFVPDSLGWIKEFEVFSSLAVINKPVYQGQYKVTEKNFDGFLQKDFVAREPGLPVQKLSLTYIPASGLKRLEAQYKESNSMYKGTRYLEMEFENRKGQRVLTHYSINGDQKMFLADSVNYKIDARVFYAE